MEVWKDIDESYEVSNYGNIRSKDREITRPYKDGFRTMKRKGEIKKQVASNDGYLRVKLYNRYKSVSHLVATAFIPNPNGYTVVHHKDHDCTNNHVSNLEWIDVEVHIIMHSMENSKYCDQISPIDGEVVKTWESTMEAERNGYNQARISDCCLGKRKTHKGYAWKYHLMN